MLDIFIHVISFVSGVFLITLSLILNTNNLLSSITFKVIPFYLGLACLIQGLLLNGWD